MDVHEGTASTSPRQESASSGAERIADGIPATANQAAVPESVAGWSWGAFLLNGAWAVGNRTWIGVFALVPVVGLPLWLVLGFKGRVWAWRKGGWHSPDHFNKVQRRWTIWALALYGLVGLAMMLLEAWL